MLNSIWPELQFDLQQQQEKLSKRTKFDFHGQESPLKGGSLLAINRMKKPICPLVRKAFNSGKTMWTFKPYYYWSYKYSWIISQGGNDTDDGTSRGTTVLFKIK